MDMNIQGIEDFASDNNVGLHVAAAQTKSSLVSKNLIWPEPKPLDIEIDREVPQIAVSQRGDILTEIARQLADSVQFPVNTAYLHALGVAASAMTKAFSISYGFDAIPCNLYIITAQPPSTGKSAINGKLYRPVFKAYEDINKETEKERAQLIAEIKRLEKDLDKETSKEGSFEEIMDKISAKQKRLDDIPHWQGTLTDTTIEAAEMVAREQGGMFNIVSAEAESINVIAGAVYGDEKGGAKANQGLLLNAWDGEYVNTRRVGRTGFTGYAKATISVIAQQDSIDTILAAGASGRGLTERFLLLLEDSLLGKRDHFKKSTLDKSLFNRYESMIENVIRESSVELSFSNQANELIKCFISSIEPELKEDGKYSNALLTGFMGKADKHIRKISAVLHVSEHWQDGADRTNIISSDFAEWAIGIFSELSKTFISASDNLGYVGKKSEIEKLKSVFIGLAEKGKLKTTVTAIRDKIKNTRPFKGSRNLQKKLKGECFPELEQCNYIVVSGNDIHINPRLR